MVSTSAASSSTSSTATSESEKAHGKEIADRLRRIFREYNSVHRRHHHRPDQAAALQTLATASAGDDSSVYREVPEIFFRPDFRLTLADIFDQTISPEAFSGGRGRTASGLSGEGSQQEHLAQYLDLVELALLKQIWTRSPQFFKALDEIKALQFQVSQATSRLKVLRERLREVDEDVALTAIRIPQMHRRMKNEITLLAKVQHMHNVLQARDAVQALLESEDFLGALDVIAVARRVYQDEQLHAVECMRSVGAQLEHYHSFVCEVMCSKFVSAAVVRGDEGLGVEGELQELLRALVVVGRLPPALSMYKARLSEGAHSSSAPPSFFLRLLTPSPHNPPLPSPPRPALKLIIRTCVMEYLQSFDPTLAVDLLDSSPEEGTGAAEQPFISRVKGMPNEHFLSCLFMTYEHLLLALGRASCVHEFLLQNMPSGSGSGSGGDKDDEAQQQAEAVRALSKSCVTTALDLSQRSVAQLLNLRKDSISKLPVEKMKFLWETSLHFCAEVEKLAGEERGCAYTVRQALVAQTTNFLAALHDQYKLALTSTLDCEKWVQCDVGVERQAKIDKLCGGGFVLGGGASATSAAAVSASSSTSSSSASSSASSSSSSSSSKQKNPAIVDGKQFKVTWSALLLTEQVVSYLDMAVSFSPAVGEIIANCCSLFKLFNLTTLKLILGSGAQKSQAQLKSISAKHLAITSQSIGLVYALLPHLRAAFLALLQHPGRQQVQLLELDRVTHELLDHHGQILAKFVVILGDSVEGSREKLNNFDFDRVAAGAKCDYFEDVARNVATLHRVLLDALPPGEVNDVFSRIFQLLGRKCLAHFEQGEVMPLTATGRARILDEVHWLGAGFAQLKGGVVGGEEGIAAIERGFRKRYGEQEEITGNDSGSAKE